MARMYADISHFRAPFKNWPSLAAADPSPPAAASADPSVLVVDKNGVAAFQPSVASAILKMLDGMAVIFIDNDNVKLDALQPSDIRQKASDWVKQKLGEGKTVVAGTTGGAQLFASGAAVDRFLSGVVGTAGEQTATAGTTPLGAVLARPSMLSGLASKLGPVGMAAVALLAVGGIVLLTKKKHHQAIANRKRSTSRKNRRRR